jgi:hypothetical protein
VIVVLYFADKAVKQKLFDRVTAAKKLTLVTVVPPHRATNQPERLEPFATLERELGEGLDQVLVVDEGKVEGMWRDPVVDLADALHPGDVEAAHAAARGYLLVQGGAAKLTVKKTQDREADLDRLERAVERLTLKRRAAPSARRRPPRGPARTVEDEPAQASDAPGLTRAWAVLGLEEGASLEEAKKAWKVLMVQYHPDKVAHLAPEFKALAENKTREIMSAWELIQAALGADG